MSGRARLPALGATPEQLAVTYEGRPKSVLIDRMEWAGSYAKLGGHLGRSYGQARQACPREAEQIDAPAAPHVPYRGRAVAAPRKPCLFSSDRLYLNVCIGLRIAGRKPSFATPGSWECIVALSGVRWLMRYGPRQGRRGIEATSIQSARPVNC